MNNNAYTLARYLRDRGIDAHVLLLDIEPPHFHPAADSYDRSYQAFTHTVAWGAPFGFRRTPSTAIARDLAPYDFLIGCGPAPAFVRRAGRRLDVFLPFGTDFLEYPFLKVVNPRYQLDYIAFSQTQRKAIREARWVHLDVSNSDFERSFLRLRCRGRRLTAPLPVVYTPIHSPATIERYHDRTHWHTEFRNVRENHDLMIFHHSRHYWKTTASEISRKANDNLIRGLAQFIAQKPDVRTVLVTMEYGVDVNASKQLIANLGIENHVAWFPQMARKDLMVGLGMADIGTGEFHRSWFSFGTMYETLAMGKPLMHYRRDELYSATYPKLYPLINVATAEEIAAALTDYVERPEHFRQMGELGRQWLLKYVIDDVLNEYTKLIDGS